MDHRSGQTDLLRHAGRIVEHRFVGRIEQVECVHEVVGPLQGLGTRHAAQHTGIDEQLAARQSVENLVWLRHEADLTLDGVDIVPDILAQNEHHARIGLEHSGHHVDRRGLARAVRPHQSIERTSRDVEREAIDSHFVVIPPIQTPNGDRHGRVGRHRTRSGNWLLHNLCHISPISRISRSRQLHSQMNSRTVSFST